LTGEEFIRNTAKSLEFIHENEKFINSERLQSVPLLVKKLAPLELVHDGQLDEVSSQASHLEALLNSYNNTIYLLSEKFAYWDSMLTAWEQHLRKKK